MRTQTTPLLLIAFLLSAMLYAATSAHSPEDPPTTGTKAEWIRLFNGRTLDGWTGDPRYWSVEDGAIVGRCGTPELPCVTTYLHHDTPYDNFELTFEIKLEGDGANSGMQYRSTALGKGKGDGFDLRGYQADFDGKHTYSGILYETYGRGIAVQRGESMRFNPDGTKVPLAPRADDVKLKKTIATGANKDGWNRYRIVANGPKLEHWINGQRTVLVEDNAKQAAAKGIFALQIHGGPPMVVKARKIRLKRLDPKSQP